MPISRETAQALAKWAKAESRKLVEAGEPAPGLPLEQWVLETWEAERPDLVTAMREWGALAQLAHVLVDRMVKAEAENLKAGLSPSDAKQEAAKDWLMFDPDATGPKELAAPTTT